MNTENVIKIFDAGGLKVHRRCLRNVNLYFFCLNVLFAFSLLAMQLYNVWQATPSPFLTLLCCYLLEVYQQHITSTR